MDKQGGKLGHITTRLCLRVFHPRYVCRACHIYHVMIHQLSPLLFPLTLAYSTNFWVPCIYRHRTTPPQACTEPDIHVRAMLRWAMDSNKLYSTVQCCYVEAPPWCWSTWLIIAVTSCDTQVEAFGNILWQMNHPLPPTYSCRAIEDTWPKIERRKRVQHQLWKSWSREWCIFPVLESSYEKLTSTCSSLFCPQ